MLDCVFDPKIHSYKVHRSEKRQKYKQRRRFVSFFPTMGKYQQAMITELYIRLGFSFSLRRILYMNRFIYQKTRSDRMIAVSSEHREGLEGASSIHCELVRFRFYY